MKGRKARFEDLANRSNFALKSGFTQFRGALMHKCPDVKSLPKFALGMALCNCPTGFTGNTILHQLAEYTTYMTYMGGIYSPSTYHLWTKPEQSLDEERNTSASRLAASTAALSPGQHMSRWALQHNEKCTTLCSTPQRFGDLRPGGALNLDWLAESCHVPISKENIPELQGSDCGCAIRTGLVAQRVVQGVEFQRPRQQEARRKQQHLLDDNL